MVALVEVAGVGLDQVMQEDVVDGAAAAGDPHQSGSFRGTVTTPR